MGFKLGVLGPSWRLGGSFGVHFGSCTGLGGQEATAKWSGRVWVGTEAAGDPQMYPTWAQLETIWSQLGPIMDPTRANLEPLWAQVEPRLAEVSQLEAIFRLS